MIRDEEKNAGGTGTGGGSAPASTALPGGAEKRRRISGLVLAALFGALIAAGTFISIPLPFSPVPVVLQNLFSLLAGLVLGPALGAAAVGLYLLAGIIGAPVFAGASGGIARALGPTGGFLLGYLFSAFTAGLIAGRPRRGTQVPLRRIILAVLAGLLVIYLPGLLRLRFAVGSWGKALIAGFLPFIPGDAIKGAAAVLIAPRLRRPLGDHFGG
ncbi:MAG: biotin transporter BioY [Treponema sp.]|jgi:biotin transport system substrate-specific component|nr:biotin transporter BioY [Treponema sp.]